ncbi:Putative pectate lyase superfamily protein [Septoria linicola]|uniref:Pectate lyase superfamily protein n=1 Tax=Septoria linicola TaxID=215465 RepID=A0A9Q9EF62_9PEZI|nr:Putative pectate lyase superfamily protein [Septoria linicola]
MMSPRGFALLTTALCATLCWEPNALVSAAPAPVQADTAAAAASGYWMATIARQGTVWGSNDTSYKIFRDVTDAQFGGGAKGDGITDDTEAINLAISSGNRCGDTCNSSTILPAIIYFPPGTYRVSKPIIMYYYTQLVGDAVEKPTIQSAANFEGMAVLDSDPYKEGGANWWTNQNNFFRQVRNFKLDLTQTKAGTGIHWQVAQATSLQNIDFIMTEGDDSEQQGIFMDNGSGGWLSDLTFTGGKFGAFLGSQQFTSRNLVFKNCRTAIYMNWNWGWTFSNVSITGGNVGIDMAVAPVNQSVGSLTLTDSSISGTKYGVNSSFSLSNNTPLTGGTLVLDNVDMSTVGTAAVWSSKDQSVVVPPGKIESWVQGTSYVNTATGNRTQSTISTVKKAAELLDADGKVYGRSKPQYENVPASSFRSVKAAGCKGDGETDDTQCIRDFLKAVAGDSNAIAYFDHGAYLIKDTITFPDTIKITGEIWPLIVADGDSFNDVDNPKPVIQVGARGGTGKGAVEITELMFETKGAAPGAIMIEWNLNSDPLETGMWDSHVRIGGSWGTQLSESECPGWPTTEATDKCHGVFLMFHARPESGGLYLENTWFWVADHDLDRDNQTQISIYSARGTLIQSRGGPVWLWGSASEHSVIYNYQIDGAKAVFGGFMQTETPYFQPNPEAPQPFAFNAEYDDPDFANCNNAISTPGVPCKDAWGLIVKDTESLLVYATGMYSFFNNYQQACVPAHNCQENMIKIQNSTVDMYTVTTKAAVNMILDDSFEGAVLAAPNRNIFGDTIAYYHSGSS